MSSRSIGVFSILAGMFQATLFQSCVAYKDSIRQQSQIIQVTSDPSGAEITAKDEDGTRRLGRTPVDFQESYQVVERTYNKASCALTGAAELSSAADDGDGEASKAEAVLGLIGLVVGAVGGAAACAEADGIVAIQPKTLGISASLPGFQPEEVTIQVPKKNPAVHFELLPQAGAPRAPTPPAVEVRPVELLPNRIAIFDLLADQGQINGQLLQDLSAYLTASVLDADVYSVVLRNELLARLGEQGFDELRVCADLDCRTRLARMLGAEYVLDTRIVATGTVCLVSASLIHSNTRFQKLIAATQTTCDRLGLMAAMDTITELLVDPPESGESP